MKENVREEDAHIDATHVKNTQAVGVGEGLDGWVVVGGPFVVEKN